MCIFCLSPSFCGSISFFLTEYQSPEYFWISHYLACTFSKLGSYFISVSKAVDSLRIVPDQRCHSSTCSTTFSNILCGQQEHLPQQELHPTHRAINTEKVLSNQIFNMLGEAGKERKMGLTEFPGMQFPYDHEMTEKLVMAKDEPKRKEISATHLFCFLYPPCDRANVCYTVLCCCVTPCLHTLICSSFEREED